jgi:8-oxo-dGTP pyrophosphatase MutT (NUDIX family)
MVAHCSDGMVTDSPRECVGAIILDLRHSVFVLRRAAAVEVAPGAWDIVGGNVKSGESDERAPAREVLEETCWIVRVVRQQVAEWQWSHGGRTRLERDYLVEVHGNPAAPQLDEREHDACTWVDSTSWDLLIEPATGDTRLRDVVRRATNRPGHIQSVPSVMVTRRTT